MPPSALAASIIASVAAALLSCGAKPPQPAAPLQAEALSAQPTTSTEAAPAADDAFLARCRAAAEYSRKQDGEVLLVLLDGKPVFEDAISGWTVDSPHLLASGTKSFSGIAAARAIEDGLLSLDERVSDTIHEWKADPRKSQVTVRQLLSLAGGIESLSGTIENARNTRAAGITDRATASIDAKTLAAPGERFIYGPSQFYVFGELMKRKFAAAKTGDADVVAYLTRKVFKPLAINPRFLRDEAGNANLPGGCRMSAKDWAVFGEFVRNGGVHEGERLLGEATLAQLMQSHGPNTAYGLTWWLMRDDEDAADPESALAADMIADRLEGRGTAAGRRLAERTRERAQKSGPDASSPIIGFMAAGKGKQRLYILPEQKLTIVRFGPLEGSKGFDNREFLRLLLGE
jgi:CubicO group peptidase (beta-lactamase class C family)